MPGIDRHWRVFLVLVADNNLWIPASFFSLFDRLIMDVFMSSA